MTEWREYKLSKIMETSKKHFKPDKNSQLNYIGLEHIEQGTLRLSGVGVSSSVESNKFFFNKGDVLFGKLRPYFRKVIYAPFDGICSTDIWVCKAKSCCDQKFLFYFLANQDFIDTANTDEGSRMPRASWDYLKDTLWILPPLPEQKAIAEVLSSLDDKIDLLTRQNKTLEDLAQTYFRKWFVEDSSDDWDVGKAEDYFEIGIGKTPPRKEHKWFTNNPNDKVWISIADMGKSGLFIGDSSEYLTSEAVERFNIRRVPKGSILLSFKLTVGRVAVALCELTTNEAIAHFKYKEAIYREYLYCYLKSFDYNSLGSTSSIATAINSTIIKEMPFVMPDKCKLTKFHELTAPIFRKIETNILQMTTLQKLRDTLLPKLISGEVRVKQ
jgi:type I restriction enzyme S subunit